MGRRGLHPGVDHSVFLNEGLGVRGAAVGQAQGQQGLHQLVGERAGIDQGHRQPLGQVVRGLVHGRGAQADHLRAVLLHALHAHLEHPGKHRLLLALHQILEVRRGVEGTHRRAVGGEAVLLDGLFVAYDRRRPLRQHREFRPQVQGEQHRGLARRHHRDVEYRSQGGHPRIAHGVDAHGIVPVGFRGEPCLEYGQVHQCPVMGTHEGGRPGRDRPVIEGSVRRQPNLLQLLPSIGNPFFLQCERDDHQNSGHGLFPGTG